MKVTRHTVLVGLVMATAVQGAQVSQASPTDGYGSSTYTTPPSPLLAIDQNRVTVVDRVVGEWGDALTGSRAGIDAEQLRLLLMAMRADQLLAASLAGSLDGLRNVVSAALVSDTPVSSALMQAKALGDGNQDLVYVPVTPCRLVETRGTFAAVYQGGGAFPPNQIRTYTLQGGNGVCLTQLPAIASPVAVQMQVYGIPTTAGSGDIEILPQGGTFGSSASLVYLGSNAFTSTAVTSLANLANKQISVQVRGGGAHVAIDVVGFFRAAVGGYVSSVTAGAGLTGGTITSSGTIAADTTYLQRRVSGTCAAGSSIRVINADGTVTCETDDGGAGTVTSVGSGTGLTGGPITTSGTLSVNTAVIQQRVSGNCAVGSSIRAIAVDGTVTCQSDGAPNAFVQNGNAFGAQAVLGTTDNNALDIRVNNARVMRYEPNSISGNVVGGSVANVARAGIRGAVIAGGGAPVGSEPLGPVTSPWEHVVRDSYGTIGGGLRNIVGDTNADVLDGLGGTVAGGIVNTASARTATVGGGSQNTASGSSATVAGGQVNQANGAYAAVGGGRENVAALESATVGGGAQNFAAMDFSTVGGGQFNQALGLRSTVGGGWNNQAINDYSTVAGGYINQASGPYGTIAGGYNNQASGDTSVVAGGRLNFATAQYSAVAGGFNNQATGVDSTVLGGEDNIASGSLSMAGGYKARANGHGCFAWGDFSTANTISCNADNRFVVRSLGGVFFFAGGSTQATYTGVVLPPGATAWVAGSDRNLKENVVAVEPREVLERVAAMPIATWNLKGQGASIRHMGPMAQDFRAAFGLGETELGISTIDADGVALAAIQGLNAKLEATIAIQARELAAQRAEIDALSAVLDGLRRTMR